MTTVIKYPLRNINPDVLNDLQEKYPEAELQIAIERERHHEGLTEQGFWELISLLDWNQVGNDDAVIEPIIAALTALPVRHIYKFDDILSQKLNKLDGLQQMPKDLDFGALLRVASTA